MQLPHCWQGGQKEQLGTAEIDFGQLAVHEQHTCLSYVWLQTVDATILQSECVTIAVQDAQCGSAAAQVQSGCYHGSNYSKVKAHLPVQETITARCKSQEAIGAVTCGI